MDTDPDNPDNPTPTTPTSPTRRNPKKYRADGTPYPSTGRHYPRRSTPQTTPTSPDPTPPHPQSQGDTEPRHNTPPTPQTAGTRARRPSPLQRQAQDRRRALGRLLAEGLSPVESYRRAGYRGQGRRHAWSTCRHPEVVAERARVVAAADEVARAKAVLSRVEALQVAARVARGETPAETVDHQGTGPAGATAWTRRRTAPLDGVRLAAELEGWTQPPGAGQQVAIQIILGGPPPGGPSGPIVLGDGRVVGPRSGASLPTAGQADTTPAGDGQNVLPRGGRSAAAARPASQHADRDGDM